MFAKPSLTLIDWLALIPALILISFMKAWCVLWLKDRLILKYTDEHGITVAWRKK